MSEGLKNDIKYLQRLVQKVNDGERNIESVSGMISRIDNQIKELDPNFIPHASIILEFRSVVKNIKDRKTMSLFEDIEIVAAKVAEGYNSDYFLVDLADELTNISRKIDKIDPRFVVKQELMEKYQKVEDDYLQNVMFSKMVKELVSSVR